MADPKSECEELLGQAVPMAGAMLTKHRAFLPFALSMSAQGDVAHVGVPMDEEHPGAQAVMDRLEEALKLGVADGTLRAAALAHDITTTPPGRDEPQDAMAVALDHRDGYSVLVVFPYAFDADGVLLIDDPFATEGEGRLFGA